MVHVLGEEVEEHRVGHHFLIELPLVFHVKFLLLRPLEEIVKESVEELVVHEMHGTKTFAEKLIAVGQDDLFVADSFVVVLKVLTNAQVVFAPVVKVVLLTLDEV